MANTERAEKIKHWLELGPESMAAQMWILYQQREKYKKEARSNLYAQTRMNAKNMLKTGVYETVKRQNECLAEILQTNGIRPKMLEISYITNNCEQCAKYNALEDECCGYIDVDCEYKSVTETIAFYAYKIDDGTISGITNDFEKIGIDDAIEIREFETGRLIYKYEEEDEEDEEGEEEED